jgi:hypothetical protein
MPEPEIGEALAITREAPPTTAVVEATTEAAPAELAYTGSSLTKVLIQIALTCLVIGPFLLYYGVGTASALASSSARATSPRLVRADGSPGASSSGVFFYLPSTNNLHHLL